MSPAVKHLARIPSAKARLGRFGEPMAVFFLLTTVDSRTALEVVIVFLGGLAGSIRAVNYALYCAAVAGAVLIAMDLPHPSNLADEGRRVLFTFIGLGIGVLVMLLANVLQRHASRSRVQVAATGS